MRDVERKIAPAVRRRSRNGAALVQTERKQTENATAALAEGANQFLWSNLASIDDARRRDVVFLSQRLDPHAPRIVQVTGNHPDRSTWSTGHFGFPEFGG